jgi:GNAT superfamily N-acetyltransferase
MIIRNVVESDYNVMISVVDDWWAGRHMADMLPKLFFVHFKDTSFVIEEDAKIVGFIIGFLSQTYLDEAYVHFMGVHPNHRKKGIGQQLYETFFATVKKERRNIVRSVTAPINRNSIIFHIKMGFEIEQGDSMLDGISFSTDYDGPGQDRVLFVKTLTAKADSSS